MKLSVIVPVYQVKPYLDFCLKSIVQQNLDDYEVILVDDCSPDGCGDICDDWAKKDSRFKAVHLPENKGLSVARNKGLETARGEYVTFVDSDDYLSPRTLGTNLDILTGHPEADVLEYPVRVHHGTEKAYQYQPGHGEASDYAGWVHRKGYIHSYAWNKIYRRSLWKEVRFPEGRWFEDLFTVPSVLRQARRIISSDQGLYYYCDRKGSISRSLCEKGVKDLLQARLQLYRMSQDETGLMENDLDEIYLRLCDSQILSIRLGIPHHIPERSIPLSRALFARRPWNYHIKAVLKAVCGKRYCPIVAQTPKALRS